MERNPLEKLMLAQVVQKCPTLYGTWRFDTVFTRARHWTLFRASWIQSIPLYHISEVPLQYEPPINA